MEKMSGSTFFNCDRRVHIYSTYIHMYIYTFAWPLKQHFYYRKVIFWHSNTNPFKLVDWMYCCFMREKNVDCWDLVAELILHFQVWGLVSSLTPDTNIWVIGNRSSLSFTLLLPFMFWKAFESSCFFISLVLVVF